MKQRRLIYLQTLYKPFKPFTASSIIIPHSSILMRVLSETFEESLSFLCPLCPNGLQLEGRKETNMLEHRVLTRSGKAFIGISKCIQEQRAQRGLRETSPKSHISKGQNRNPPLSSPSSPPLSLPKQDLRNHSVILHVVTFILGLVFIYAYARYKSEKRCRV